MYGRDKQERTIEGAWSETAESTPWHLKNLGDYPKPNHECNFVSPITKTAGNIGSNIFVLLQDWTSEDAMDKEKDMPAAEVAEMRERGYDPDSTTFKRLINLLRLHFEKSLHDIYASNVFPLIKPKGTGSAIPLKDMRWGAEEFTLPQIAILRPRLTVILGLASIRGVQCALRRPRSHSLASAVAAPFDCLETRIWCQAHPAARISNDQLTKGWKEMADWYRRTK